MCLLIITQRIDLKRRKVESSWPISVVSYIVEVQDVLCRPATECKMPVGCEVGVVMSTHTTFRPTSCGDEMWGQSSFVHVRLLHLASEKLQQPQLAFVNHVRTPLQHGSLNSLHCVSHVSPPRFWYSGFQNTAVKRAAIGCKSKRMPRVANPKPLYTVLAVPKARRSS